VHRVLNRERIREVLRRLVEQQHGGAFRERDAEQRHHADADAERQQHGRAAIGEFPEALA
jgi:hypothetical protein